jgi:hypothetical protein
MAATKIFGGQIADNAIVTALIEDGAVTAAKLNVTLDQISAPVAAVDMNGQLLSDLANPVGDADATPKLWVEDAIATALTSALVYKGVIDCSTNPNYPAATQGWVYVVSVAGKIGGASGVSVQVDDTVICNTTNGGGDQATVGADFNVIQGNVDGAVIGPASAVSGNVPSFNGTTGKLIQDSGKAAASLVLGPASVTDSNFAQFDGTTGKLLKGGLAFSTSTSLGTSDTAVPSQNAVKTYVDDAIAALPADSSFADGEVPSGTVDGNNVTFTLAATPITGSLHLYVNGVRMKSGVGNDYTISTDTITFATAPLTGSVLLADYRYAA